MSKFAQPLLALSLCLPSALAADEPDPRVQKILDSWKTQLTQMKSYHLKAKVFQYDAVFQVERRADLEAAWSPAGHRIVRWTPAEIQEGGKSDRTSDDGDRYQLENREQEYWFSPAGETVIQWVNRFGEKSTTEQWTWGQFFEFMHSFGLNTGFLHPPFVRQPIDRIKWTIVAEDEQTLTLLGLPQAKQEQRNFSELKVVVSRSNYSLRSIQTTDPAKTTQTVLRVVEVEVDIPLPNNSPVFRIPDGGERQVYQIPAMNADAFGR